MTTQADGIHSDEPEALLPCPFCGGTDIRVEQAGGWTTVRCNACHAERDSASHSEAIARWNRRPTRADASPPWIEKAPAEDTIASHLRNLQQLIELRTERPHCRGAHCCGGFASTATFVGDELDAVNARIAKALALAEQQDVRQIEMLRRALEEITWGKGPYSVDELTFAGNVVERGKDIARRALAGTYSCELAEQVTT